MILNNHIILWKDQFCMMSTFTFDAWSTFSFVSTVTCLHALSCSHPKKLNRASSSNILKSVLLPVMSYFKNHSVFVLLLQQRIWVLGPTLIYFLYLPAPPVIGRDLAPLMAEKLWTSMTPLLPCAVTNTDTDAVGSFSPSLGHRHARQCVHTRTHTAAWHAEAHTQWSSVACSAHTHAF